MGLSIGFCFAETRYPHPFIGRSKGLYWDVLMSKNAESGDRRPEKMASENGRGTSASYPGNAMLLRGHGVGYEWEANLPGSAR